MSKEEFIEDIQTYVIKALGEFDSHADLMKAVEDKIKENMVKYNISEEELEEINKELLTRESDNE